MKLCTVSLRLSKRVVLMIVYLTVISPGVAALRRGPNCLMKMSRKGCGRKRSLPDFNNCTGICMEGLLKALENCNGFCSVRDSSQTLSGHEAYRLMNQLNPQILKERLAFPTLLRLGLIVCLY
jgi:hypothetical protein